MRQILFYLLDRNGNFKKMYSFLLLKPLGPLLSKNMKFPIL